MESFVEAIGTAERLNTANSTDFAGFNASASQLFEKLLSSAKAVAEYAFGMYIGYVIGWLLGLYAGKVYVGHFEPVYLSDLGEIRLWEIMPYGFARDGAIIGVVAGAIAIAIINSKLLRQRVVHLCEKGVTEPKDISQVMGKSERQIQKVISRLAKKANSL